MRESYDSKSWMSFHKNATNLYFTVWLFLSFNVKEHTFILTFPGCVSWGDWSHQISLRRTQTFELCSRHRTHMTSLRMDTNNVGVKTTWFYLFIFFPLNVSVSVILLSHDAPCCLHSPRVKSDKQPTNHREQTSFRNFWKSNIKRQNTFFQTLKYLLVTFTRVKVKIWY